ncbi:MAG: hypothetical protein M0038_15465 [Pseudomonadota bacterium]|jgi:hypothetical protein|nr:hypothetical protein [Pseudomonadota bacterium]
MKFIYAVFLDKGLIGVFSSARKAERFRKAQAKRIGERLVVVRLGLNEKLEERQPSIPGRMKASRAP